jgi:hypothetical protein
MKKHDATAIGACLGAALLVSACATTRFDGPDGDRLFYEARCGLCHVPWPRADYEPDEWPGIVDDMAPRAGLTQTQRERVLAYLIAR